MSPSEGRSLASKIRRQAAISDYGLIGDCETAALVCVDGSIDWLCWPRFDSGACFASLLGDGRHGTWRIAPRAMAKPRRSYRDGTLILETDFETSDGAASVIDFMTVRGEGSDASDLVRIAVGRRGSVAMRMDLVIRFDYGRIVPWVSRVGEGRLRAVAGPHAVVLDTPVETHGENLKTVADFVVTAGDRVPFVLTYTMSHHKLPAPLDAEAALDATERYWTGWTSRNRYSGPWSEAVSRSLITIKALTYSPTGGIVAAPTTSLPEGIGGSRNWDYRYCWLRDTTFTLRSLIAAGYREEAEAWSDWLLRAVAGAASQVQPLYGIGGEHRLDEIELPWLPGYRRSGPVRIGNAAHNQLQLDVFGSVMDTLFEARRHGLTLHEAGAGLQRELLRHLERVWTEPDEGIWEVRSGRQHFVHSKVMCWVAFDRAVAAAERFALAGAVERWRRLRDTIHSEVLERGFDPKRGTFVQAYGSDCLDAAALLIPLVGFLPPGDLRIRSTVSAIERELGRGGLLMRYDPAKTIDGLPGDEGTFLACSFWLVDNMILQGRVAEADVLFRRLLSLRNELGLLSEEFDVTRGTQVGNFPQAFSHVALVDSAFNFAPRRGVDAGHS